MSQMQFKLADEPEFEAREKGRLLFAGPVDFVKGVVALQAARTSENPA